MLNLNTNILAGLELSLPPMDEQYRILAVIDEFQNACLKSEAEIAKYAALKQALMNDLLAGRVRAPVGAER
jgi:restriction endonuclease S subunit